MKKTVRRISHKERGNKKEREEMKERKSQRNYSISIQSQPAAHVASLSHTGETEKSREETVKG